MKQVSFLLMALFIWPQAYAQAPTIDLTIHSRVDTTKQEIKEIVTLWVNYLTSKPDSIYDNPYWNEEEKKKYEDFDFTRSSMYQMPSAHLLANYKPTILSIEKEGDSYAIRTLFNADGMEGMYRKYNPWCITRLHAVKENGAWKLKNALPIITKSWDRKTIGKINFIYSHEHQFNEALAQKANRFCDSIVSKFQFPDWKPFDFYITTSGDELGKLLGFDFFFAGYTTGKGLNDKRILLSGLASEWYPHEFIHLIVEDKKRHWIVEEGFATWIGGANQKQFEEMAVTLAENLAENDTVTFDDILSRKWGWQFNAYYATGAIVCQMVYDKGGLNSVKRLLDTPQGDNELKKVLCELLMVEPKYLDKALQKEILKYLKTK